MPPKWVKFISAVVDMRLGLVMTVPVPFLCLWVWIHGRRMNRLFLRAWRKWSRVTDVVSDTIPGMKVVKAFHQEARERGRFDRRNREATDEFNAIHSVWTLFWPATFGRGPTGSRSPTSVMTAVRW